MSSNQNVTKAATAHETEKDQDTIAQTIAYARQTYKGNQKDTVKVELEKYVRPLL